MDAIRTIGLPTVTFIFCCFFRGTHEKASFQRNEVLIRLAPRAVPAVRTFMDFEVLGVAFFSLDPG